MSDFSPEPPRSSLRTGKTAVVNWLGERWRDTGLARADRALLIIFLAAFAISWIARVTVAVDLPLWLDEAWTGAIVGQSSWSATVHQIWLDANAPLYYLFMHAWTGVFGLSNEALRFPSLIFSLATPLVVVATRIDGLKVEDRLALAAVLTVWVEGLVQADEARCYALLTLLATCQTLAFARLMTGPSVRRTAIWAALGALVIVTHYQAVMLGAAQGIIYLRAHQVKAVRTWPGGLAFLPAFGVLAWHLPKLLQFARPDVAWYDLADSGTLVYTMEFLTGSWWLYVLPVCGICFLAWRQMRRHLLVAEQAGPETPWLTGIAAVLGLLLMAGIGFFRPSFTYRYATPFVPGISLLLVLGARALTPAFPGARAGLMLMALLHSAEWADRSAGHLWHPYSYEIASYDLLATHPSRLVFIWDHPAQRVETPEQYVAAGGFFFHRAGSTAEVTPVMVKPGEDANLRLLNQAKEPGAVILWLYDTHVRGTSAAVYPPRIESLDPSFGCHNYGRGRIGVLACARSWAGGAWPSGRPEGRSAK